MSEVSNQNRSRNGRADRRSAFRMQTHLDMTPMVDLAFLLLTFFMLSASFLIQKRMEVTLPKKGQGEPTPVNCHKVITLMVLPGDKLYYYTCYEESGLKSIPFSNQSLSSLFKQSTNGNKDMVVLIKMDDHANYERFVTVIDELKSNGIEKYTLANISKQDKTLLKEKANI